MTLVALLGVLAVGACGAYAVFAASAPATPTFTATPSNPSNLTATSISYTDSQLGVTFGCTLDGASKVCSSVNGSGGTTGSASLTGLSNGSHTFAVTATSGGKTSSAGSYTWMVDTTAPTVSPPALAGTSPTNATSVSWTVTFSEPVKNVVAGNFAFAATNLTGSSITGVSGSGASYTVTASTGSLTNATQNGSLGLNMVNKGSGAAAISDLAGNALSTTMPQNGAAAYTVDRVAPPAPTISSGPAQGSTGGASATFGFTDSESRVTYLCKLDAAAYADCTNPTTFSGLADGSHTLIVEAKDAAGNPSSPSATRTWTVDATAPPKPTIVGPNNKSDSTAATFTFSDSEAGVSFKCSVNGSAYTDCTSPKTYTLLPSGTNVFDVEPIDAAGNIGPFNEWKWTINGLSSGGQQFAVSGNASGALYPGGSTAFFDLSLTNPNSVAIFVTSLTVTLASITPHHSGPNPCSPSLDFTAPVQFSGSYPITLPANSTRTLSQLGFLQAQMPRIAMLNRPLNQDACKGATLNFTYSGQAQS